MKRVKRHFHCIYSIAVTCYCIWLLWACHAAYKAFDDAFLAAFKYVLGMIK